MVWTVAVVFRFTSCLLDLCSITMTSELMDLIPLNRGVAAGSGLHDEDSDVVAAVLLRLDRLGHNRHQRAFDRMGGIQSEGCKAEAWEV